MYLGKLVEEASGEGKVAGRGMGEGTARVREDSFSELAGCSPDIALGFFLYATPLDLEYYCEVGIGARVIIKSRLSNFKTPLFS